MLRHETAPDCSPEPTRIQRIALDGKLHMILSLSTLEGLRDDLGLRITPPSPAPGWSTAHCSNLRLAAWTEVVR